ncbi:RSMH [Blepharisma stoltei]|uniref:16S rRNA m(4)C1402 methyltransferase n=1 Tax=Blepharisma stoltei TaxID=1481888 RepID=A0AAU9KK15_9CILI|nr:unnamed protein product [Blepharisma stoltei]
MFPHILKRCIGEHYPVMWRNIVEIVESRFPQDSKLLVGDATVGAGGHSRALLELYPNSRIIGVDIDKEMLAIAEKNTADFSDRIKFHHTSYTNMFSLPRFPEEFTSGKGFDVLIADLGLSSVHLDTPERGFAFRTDGPLDMRFDRTKNQLTAEKILNHASEYELVDIFKRYGNEQYSETAAEIICQYRKENKITSTMQLTKVLNYAFYIAKSFKKYDNITRIFQALRIKVNNELDNVENFLKNAINNLDEKGVLIVISFHSLEDDIVHKYMKKANGQFIVEYKTWKPMEPGHEEMIENSRSRSALLRYLIKRDFNKEKKIGHESRKLIN